MKRSYVLLIVLFALPLLDVFYSCCNCNDDVVDHYYSFSDFSVKNIDNSGQNPLESEQEEINKNAYGIRLYINKELLSNSEKSTNNKCYLFSSSAYAFSCDCDFSSYNLVNPIQSIKIFTLQDFNNEKLANSDISEYFNVIHTYKTVEESIEDINKVFNRTSLDIFVDYLLMNAPSPENINHQFRVEITLENEEIINLETIITLI